MRHLSVVFSEPAATKWLLPPPLAHPWAERSPSPMKHLVFSQAGSMICCQVRSRWIGVGESSLPIEGRGPRTHPWFQFRKTSGKQRRNVCHNGQKELKSLPHNGKERPLMTRASHYALHPDPNHTPVTL